MAGHGFLKLIVTRPEPDASRTAEALRRLGHEPILSPMLDISYDSAALLPERPFQAVLVTSRNAVRALAAHPGRERLAVFPVLAVGDQTALEARRAGFAARSAGGAVGDLLALATAELRPDNGPVLYLAGDEQAGDLAGALKAQGFSVDTAIVYRASPRDRLAPAAAAALQHGPIGVLLYSHRSAVVFAQALWLEGLAPLPASVTAFCLSGSVAEPLIPATTGKVFIAASPNQLSLFALMESAGS